MKLSLTQPSQLSAFEAGKLFIFSECNRKVSTTFGVEVEEPTRQRSGCAEAVVVAVRSSVDATEAPARDSARVIEIEDIEARLAALERAVNATKPSKWR